MFFGPNLFYKRHTLRQIFFFPKSVIQIYLKQYAFRLYIVHCKDTLPKQMFPEKELHGLSPSLHIHISATYSAAGKYAYGSCEYINRSQTHKCKNWN
jgi:hypothetical protein